MNRDQYQLLFEKFLVGTATPHEVDLIMQYRDQFELSNLHPKDDPEQYKEIEERILNKLKFNIQDRKPVVPMSKWWATAAAVLLFTIGAFLYRAHEQNQGKLFSRNVINQNSIHPGANKALLTLANGKQIALNEAASGTIVKQGNIVVRKKQDGVLQYESASNAVVASGNENETVGYNTITTPRGGQYQVILPDGTKVWLNSASTLKYPTAFTGNERKVELTGEGYFEVAENKKMPFKVKLRGEEVEDLGTHFNIMAYEDEGETQTTLLEGSVKVSKGSFSRVLIPGQQTSSKDDESAFIVRHAVFVNVMAWKNGIFSFQNSSIRQIMRQISRWYDVDVVYQDNLEDKNKIYGGSVSKSKNISEILSDLELTGTIHFKVEGRRITVMQ